MSKVSTVILLPDTFSLVSVKGNPTFGKEWGALAGTPRFTGADKEKSVKAGKLIAADGKNLKPAIWCEIQFTDSDGLVYNIRTSAVPDNYRPAAE